MTWKMDKHGETITITINKNNSNYNYWFDTLGNTLFLATKELHEFGNDSTKRHFFAWEMVKTISYKKMARII